MYVIIIPTWNLTMTNDMKNHRCISTIRTLMTNIRKTHPLAKIVNNSFIDLPAPSNISAWWNFGSLLGVCLILQILTGLFLAMHYTSDTATAFSSVTHICRDVNYRLNYPLYARKWRFHILYLPIPTCRTRPILRILCIHRNMKHWNCTIIRNHSHSIHGLCTTMRTNIILRSNCNH